MRPTLLTRFRLIAAVLLATVAAAQAADPGDEFWTPACAPAGVQGDVLAMVSHTGVLYIGGSFNAVGAEPVRYIAALYTDGSPGMTVTGAVPLGEGSG